MSNCYEGVGERTDGMTGKELAARPVRSGRRAFEAGRSTSSTEGVTRRLDVETGRLLFDDGRTMPRRPTSGKSQRYRRVEGRSAAGRDTGSHMRQEDRAIGLGW